jgi:hypothetical protein
MSLRELRRDVEERALDEGLVGSILRGAGRILAAPFGSVARSAEAAAKRAKNAKAKGKVAAKPGTKAKPKAGQKASGQPKGAPKLPAKGKKKAAAGAVRSLRRASTTQLERTAKRAKNPQMRVAAKRELARRKAGRGKQAVVAKSGTQAKPKPKAGPSLASRVRGALAGAKTGWKGSR